MEPLSADVWWKVIGYAGIPLVMAGAGIHLAADAVKSEKVKLVFRALFVCLAALGILIVAVVEQKSYKEHNGEVLYQRQQYEYQRDQNTRMTQTLQDGLAASALLERQLADFRNDLRSMQGKPSVDISRLEQRAQQAENAANSLSTYYSQQSKIQNWPFGAAGKDYPGLHVWFGNHFPESTDINGQDRFFLYYLMKHGGEIQGLVSDVVRQLNELDGRYKQEFPGIGGSPVMESMTRLERLGFLERRFSSDGGPKLKEPYYSRFKNQQIP